MSVFKPNNDDEYKNWIKKNLIGFVINTYKIPSSTYMVLHTHKCHSINDLAITAGEDAFTSNGYTKICANAIGDLETWLSANNFTISKECQKCNPRDSFVISEMDAKKIMSDFNKLHGGEFNREKLIKNRDYIIAQIRKGVSPEVAFFEVS